MSTVIGVLLVVLVVALLAVGIAGIRILLDVLTTPGPHVEAGWINQHGGRVLILPDER